MPNPSSALPIVNERSVAQADAGASIIDMENLIKRKVENLDKLRIERKAKKEQYDDSFNNNPLFVEKKKAHAITTQEKKKITFEIAKQPAVAKLKQEVDDIALSIRQQEKSISVLLMDYTDKRPEVTQLELFDGRFASIVKTAKLSKPKKPKKRRFR